VGAAASDGIAALAASAPPALLERMRAALGDEGSPEARLETPEGDAARALAAGERLLERVLREGRQTRTTALDLLAADALVTYAFEHWADDPGLEATARAALARISGLAAPARPRGPGEPSP
jgi:hypothetical protein